MDNLDLNILVKIPCIIASCVGTHVTWSPPAQSGKSEQLPPSDWVEKFMRGLIPHIWFVRATWWVIGFTEIIAILLRLTAPSPRLPLGISQLELSWTTFVGVSLIAAGAAIRYACYKTLAKHFTFELSIQTKHKLITNGPYSIVRHPSYSGHVLVYIGLVLWHCSKGSWLRESGVAETLAGQAFFSAFTVVLLIIIYALLIRVPKEDQKLREVFGKEWDDYATRVPYTLVPGIL